MPKGSTGSVKDAGYRDHAVCELRYLAFYKRIEGAWTKLHAKDSSLILKHSGELLLHDSKDLTLAPRSDDVHAGVWQVLLFMRRLPTEVPMHDPVTLHEEVQVFR